MSARPLSFLVVTTVAPSTALASQTQPGHRVGKGAGSTTHRGGKPYFYAILDYHSEETSPISNIYFTSLFT